MTQLIRTQAPLFLYILLVSTIISLSSISDVEASGGNLFKEIEEQNGRSIDTSTTLLAGSSFSFKKGRISGNLSVVIIAPCSSDNHPLHLSPNSTYHKESNAFASSCFPHPLQEMACWRSSLNIITLHLQSDSGIMKNIAEEHLSTGEKVLCGAFLCWNRNPESIESKSTDYANRKDGLPLHQNAHEAPNMFPLSAVATGRCSSSTVHCGLAKGNLSLYCWGKQFADGKFLAPVLLDGYVFQVVHPETGNEKRSSDAPTSAGRRRAHATSHFNVNTPVLSHGTPSATHGGPSTAIVSAAAPSSPPFAHGAPSSPAEAPSSTISKNTAPRVPSAPSSPDIVPTAGPAVNFVPSSPTVAPAAPPSTAPTSSITPPPSSLVVAPTPATSNTAPAPAPAASHKSNVATIKQSIFAVGAIAGYALLLLVVAVIFIAVGFYYCQNRSMPDQREVVRVHPISDDQEEH